MFVTELCCINCGKTYPIGEVQYYCPGCGFNDGILDVKYDYDKIEKVFNSITLKKASLPKSIWRYLPLLPIEDIMLIPNLHLGYTPIYDAKLLAEYLDVSRCFIKDEGRNPTASFKDRASVIGVIKAKEAKAKRITCASTGNAASSLAGFAAAGNVKATIFVPKNAPEAKIAQLLVFGAEVFTVDGTYDMAWDLCMKVSEEYGWYNRNCAINPFLVEGKKTVAFELTEQLSEFFDIDTLDWLAVSVGDGCTIASVWKGLKEMHQLGFIKRLPKLLGVQAEGCQPFVKAWTQNTELEVCLANTIADSIAVGHPRNFRKGLSSVKDSKGSFIAVKDQEILAAINYTARLAGVFSEPAGAAAIAGIKVAREQGIITHSERVAAIITGNGLKDIKAAMLTTGQPTLIKPNILDAIQYINEI